MQTLTGAGNYEQARRDWAAVSGVDLARAGPLFDPQFTDDSTPPPFNWSLGSSSAGVSERKPGGGLHLIAYGHDQGSLASQLLLLQPGAYRIGLEAPGFAPTGGMIRLSVTCSGSNAGLLSVPLDQLVQRDASFSVPAGCPAQTLAIEGTVSDMPQQHEVTIRAIRLSREQARG
jgi:hypothetical protein